MELTGKCKEDFQMWYDSDREAMNYWNLETSHYEERGFYDMSDSMQYGVYVDFFDSVGVCIEISIDYTRQGYGKPLYQWKVVRWDAEEFGYLDLVRTRHEARTKAIEKANELYNKN